MICINGEPSRIARRLYQAGKPLTNPKPHGFDAVVLCAVEEQDQEHPGTVVVRAPMDDAPITREILDTAHVAAAVVGDLLDQDKNVLITCYAGINRSGLVTGITLVNKFGMTGAEAVKHIRRHRPIALSNRSFVEYLRSL